MTIAVDFDGTIVEHRYPRIGREIPFATDTLKLLQQDQHRLILWSVREGELLEEAVAWCKERGVEFYDDRNLGGLPAWGLIYELIKERKTFRDIYTQGNIPAEQDKKKKWWF